MEASSHSISQVFLIFNCALVQRSNYFNFQNATVSLDWSLFEQQSLQEDGSIVILFRSPGKNGQDPQQIHIMTIYGKFLLDCITKIFEEKKLQN